VLGEADSQSLPSSDSQPHIRSKTNETHMARNPQYGVLSIPLAQIGASTTQIGASIAQIGASLAQIGASLAQIGSVPTRVWARAVFATAPHALIVASGSGWRVA